MTEQIYDDCKTIQEFIQRNNELALSNPEYSLFFFLLNISIPYQILELIKVIIDE